MEQNTRSEASQVLGFLEGAVKEHLHTSSRLTRARDEVDRLRRALAAAEQTVIEAERDVEGQRTILRDAFDLARQGAAAPVCIEKAVMPDLDNIAAEAVAFARTGGLS